MVAAALEGSRTPAARQEAGEAFARWEQLIADALARQGVVSDRARSLATLILASIEGAVVLARGQRTSGPLERVARELQSVARASIRARVEEPRADAEQVPSDTDAVRAPSASPRP